MLRVADWTAIDRKGNFNCEISHAVTGYVVERRETCNRDVERWPNCANSGHFPLA
jgi:hypothetical protein